MTKANDNLSHSNSIAVGLIWRTEELVVGRRPNGVSLAGYDEFPGGKCQPGESPAEAAVRECREETGLDIEVIRLRLMTDHAYSFGHLKLYFFDCRLRANSLQAPRPPFRWARVAEVLTLQFPQANQDLLHSLRQFPYPLVGQSS